MFRNKSLTAQLTLYVVLTLSAILVLGLALNYYFTRQALLNQLAVRAGNLADQISYAIEVLAGQDDIFSIHRVVEQTASLEDVLTVAVVDRSGRVLSHNKKQLLNQPFNDPLIAQAIHTEQRVEEFTSRRFAIADPLHGEKYDLDTHSDVIGAIWIEMDLASVQAALVRQYTFIASVIAGLLLLTGLMMMLMLRHTVIYRLRILTNALTTVSAGNLDFRLHVPQPATTQDEIAASMHHFNHMAVSLQEQIAQKLEAQTAQQESDRQLAQVLDVAGDAIVTIDAGYMITSFNRGAETIFGYTAAEVIGQPLNRLLPARVHQIHNHHLDYFAAKPNRSVHPYHQRIALQAARKNGEVFPAEASISKLELNGNLTMTAILRDVTAQKEAEAELRHSEARNRAMLDAIPDLMFRFDRHGRILDYKGGDEQSLYLPPEEFLGQSVFEVLPPNVAAGFDDHFQNLHQTGHAQIIQYQLPYTDGLHTFEARLVLIDDEESLAIVRDITEAARLEQMKTDFINRASHELRTPLTTAKIMIELIQDGGEEEELAEYWNVLQLELQRQQELVEDLLTVGRLESGNLKIMTHPVNLQPLIEECVLSLRQLSGVKEQSITLNIAPDLPQVCGDESNLMRVFTNLFSNAIKFTPYSGQITLTAGLIRDEQVEIIISDTGIGIPPEDLPSLFGRFFRATNATQQEIPGSGIGLYMVKAIIDEIGGRISVTSQLNQGTTFKIVLRVEEEDPELIFA